MPRRNSGITAKDRRELALIQKAAVLRDLQQGKLFLLQQRARTLDAHLDHILVGGHAHGLPKQSNQIVRTDLRHLGEIFERYGFIEVLLDVGQNAPLTARAHASLQGSSGRHPVAVGAEQVGRRECCNRLREQRR